MPYWMYFSEFNKKLNLIIKLKKNNLSIKDLFRFNSVLYLIT